MSKSSGPSLRALFWARAYRVAVRLLRLAERLEYRCARELYRSGYLGSAVADAFELIEQKQGDRAP